MSYHYKHLTLQEFLAALLLSWISEEERRKVVEKFVADGRYTMTLRFLSGLAKTFPISRDHRRTMLIRGEDQRNIFQSLFEGGDKAFTTSTDILGKKIRVHSYFYWSALDYFVMSKCIAQSNCSWDVNFRSSSIDDEKFTLFLQALSSTEGERGEAYITSLDLYDTMLTSQSLSLLQDIPSHFLCHLKSFNVSKSNLDHVTVDYIAKIIPHMPELEKLFLSTNRGIQRGDAVSLLSVLCNNKTLKSIHLSYTSIGKEDCEQLSQLLSSSQCLEELDLSDVSLSLDSITTLVHGLSQNNSLKEINLSFNPLGDEGAAALGEAINKMTITKIKLVRCGITATGGAALVSSLLVSSTLEELDVSFNELKEAVRIFAHLIELKTLKRLTIHHDDSLSQSDVDLLLNSLTNNQTLEALVLPVKFKVDTDKRVMWW